MCRGSGAVAAIKKLTTMKLPGSSSELAVGVHLMTHLILQRDHISRCDLASALGRDRLERTAAPDLSGRSLRRPQMGPRGNRDLTQNVDFCQIWIT